MGETHLYKQVKALLTLTDEARSDGHFSMAEAGAVFGEVVQAALHVAGALQDRHGHFEALVEACERLFDEYVAPIDLAIPNMLEPAVERLIKAQIRPMLGQAYDVMEG